MYPIVFINTKVGKPDELLKKFKKDMTQVIAEVCEIPAETVAVYFIEHRI